MAEQRVTISLSRELYLRVHAQAERRSESISQLVRAVLEEWASKEAAYAQWQETMKRGLDFKLDGSSSTETACTNADQKHLCP